MTPIKKHLQEILARRKSTFAQLARDIDIEYVHFAKILNGTFMGHPKKYVVDRMIKALKLNADEESLFREKARISIRMILLPNNATIDDFEAMHLFNDCLLNHQAEKMESILKILKTDNQPISD